MGRNKLTSVQILERYKAKPNPTVGDFNNALNRAGFKWISGTEKFFVNGHITWTKNGEMYSCELFDDAIDAAIAFEHDVKSFKESNAIMMKALNVMQAMADSIECSIASGTPLTPEQTVHYTTECGAYHLRRIMESLS